MAHPRPTEQALVTHRRAYRGISPTFPVAFHPSPVDPDVYYLANKGSTQEPQEIGHLLRFVVAPTGETTKASFLDLSDRVVLDNEAGIIGFTLHPDFASNGHFFVTYTAAPGDPFTMEP